MPFAEDLSVFFNSADFGSAATWNAQSATVILDTPTEDILGGRAQSNEYTATLRASDFAAIKRGDVITIATTNYQVREIKLLDDGAIKQLLLTKQ